MWKDDPIKVLMAGNGTACGPFLETVRAMPGVELVALLDHAARPESLELSRSLGVPLVDDLEALSGREELDIIILAGDDPEQSGRLRRQAAGRTLVLERGAARLVRLLAERLCLCNAAGPAELALRREAEDPASLDRRIIGKSPQVLEVQELIRRVAPTPTTVLLLGETGTGKDLAARSIHRAGPLRDAPFIAINCTALTPSLMESELFGYVRGAFTGAERDKPGLLEEADGGTVFLDEIGDMQAELQAKLLRFLQTGELRRVGSTQTRQVAVRVIAATNRDMGEAVAAGRFRRDLYYRFNTFTITLPPLRRRRMDIPYLALHFLTKAEAKLNRRLDGISQPALAAMAAYDWPGNIRELENVIERAAILCRQGAIGPEDLALPGLDTAGPAGSETAPGAGGGFDSARERIMDTFEKKEILRYLKMADGSVTRAAELSGIPRRTLYRKIRKHGL
ncbi:MAG: sigma 54-interacting transcriptional regulator [Thermodesulfobacteriota bacterium]